MRTIPFFLIFLLLSGCASYSMGNRYLNEFNDAVSKDKNTTAFSSQPFETIKDDLLLDLKSMGYKRILYADTEQGFIVASKQGTLTSSFLAGDPNASVILVKFTNTRDGQIRVDLVNGASNMLSGKNVNDDIAQLASAIK